MGELSTRLAVLQRQAGASLAATAGGAGESLAAQVQRLALPERGSRRVDESALAERLGGRCLAPGLIAVERSVALSTLHGGQRLVAGLDLERPPAVLAMEAAGRPHEWLFLDTETTGLAGGTGTLVFVLGLARVGPQGLELCQYLLTTFAGEPALLDAARPWLDAARTLVSFNGKRFDLPLLATRYRLAGRADPCERHAHLDLLYPTRRAFAQRWPDCRLQTAEQRLLGFHRVEDLPGHEVPLVWFEWVRYGVADRLAAVLRHNHWDLLSLVRLTGALTAVFTGTDDAGADPVGVARSHLRRGDASAALAALAREGRRLDAEGWLLAAQLQRRQGNWDGARAIWEALAEEGNREALERLAKFHEHQRRDYDAAAGYVERLLRLAPAPQHWHRQRRLQAKRSAESTHKRGGQRAAPSPPE